MFGARSFLCLEKFVLERTPKAPELLSDEFLKHFRNLLDFLKQNGEDSVRAFEEDADFAFCSCGSVLLGQGRVRAPQTFMLGLFLASGEDRASARSLVRLVFVFEGVTKRETNIALGRDGMRGAPLAGDAVRRRSQQGA